MSGQVCQVLHHYYCIAVSSKRKVSKDKKSFAALCSLSPLSLPDDSSRNSDWGTLPHFATHLAMLLRGISPRETSIFLMEMGECENCECSNHLWPHQEWWRNSTVSCYATYLFHSVITLSMGQMQFNAWTVYECGSVYNVCLFAV